ncbi:TolC family protein [Vibrio vulnificus]|uniref:TolC family protein n=1 Tax=Vibrio vulnificus TaxID=672 RepID=A0A2S3QYH5_VIBVL|nr:TolC family protein [Vibrio vulnificus]ADV89422.1 type I secretion outer membrane protein TolC precursor [Vibrio vulnificus MO6-24/O]AIL73453.1 type I secretion outer membrane protein TolC [Vibrio vulnificus]EGR0038786.1 TolC family protein [Vibrio vulnificus]EGR0092160.1 TolC family protein [Vibrio vulnificus]EGR0787281.1 TolC family protein [Vibrio vulnificus]
MVNKHLSKIGLAVLAATLSLPSHAISIEQAWQQAKQNDPNYEKAKIGVQLGQAGVDSSRSALLPDLSASASLNWSESADSSNSYGATLSQTIWDSSLWSSLDQAKANYLKSELELSQAHNELAQKLLSAYLDLASAQGDLVLAQTKLDEGNKLLQIIEKRYQAGKVKSVDVEEMRATQVSEQATILNAQADLEVKRAELAALINQVPDSVDQIRTDTLIQPPMLVTSQAQWLKLAKDSSPELLVAAQMVKASEFAKQSAKGGYYPTLRGSVGYSDGDQRSNGEFNAGLTLSVPIDLNGSVRSKVDEASLNILSAKQEMRRVEIDIQKRVIQQFTQVEINWNQVLIANELVASRGNVLASKEKLYDAGLLEVSDVISAHNSLFEAKHSLQTNLYNYWRQRIALLQTAGKLDDDIMVLISRAFHS